MIASLTLATGYAVPATTSNSMELLGYYENWNTVKWWDNDIPGNCAMGCAVPQAFMEQLAPYSSLNYGFTFLVETPNPDQVACTTPSTCPLWDGGGIYIGVAYLIPGRGWHTQEIPSLTRLGGSIAPTPSWQDCSAVVRDLRSIGHGADNVNVQ